VPRWLDNYKNSVISRPTSGLPRGDFWFPAYELLPATKILKVACITHHPSPVESNLEPLVIHVIPNVYHPGFFDRLLEMAKKKSSNTFFRYQNRPILEKWFAKGYRAVHENSGLGNLRSASIMYGERWPVQYLRVLKYDKVLWRRKVEVFYFYIRFPIGQGEKMQVTPRVKMATWLQSLCNTRILLYSGLYLGSKNESHSKKG